MFLRYCFMGCLLSFASVTGTTLAHERLDDTPRLAVMSAFEPEIVLLTEATMGRSSHSLNGVTFTTGTLDGMPVVLFLSGVSVVNAAMTTQLALDHFEISGIVFSGIAGGVDPDLNIGDVVIAEKWGQYLESVFAREAESWWIIPPFFQFQFPNFGMMHPRAVSVTRDGEDTEESRFWFEVDPEMFEMMQSVSDAIELEQCAGPDLCLDDAPNLVIGGNGVSGSVFVDNAAFRTYTFDTFSARVLDMESAAVAHVAYANATPFIAIRSLSDLAGGGEGENEIGTFFQLAANNSAVVVRALLASRAGNSQ